MDYFTLDFIFIVLMILFPVLLWMWVFQQQQREKRAYVALAFLAGMLSVLPIKLYERYWDVVIYKLETLSLFSALADVVNFQSLPTLMAFIITSMIVALGLFLFVAIMMFFLEIISGDNTIATFRKKFRRIMEEPAFFVTVGIFIGLYAYFSTFSLHEKIYFFLIVGMLEEFVKHLVVRFSDEFKLRSVNDAIAFSIVVALGFAFVENILYFVQISQNAFVDQELYVLMMLRSVVSVSAHIIFSAIFGYFYGISQFSTRLYRKKVIEKRAFFINLIHKIIHLKAKTVFHEEQLFLGLFCAMGLHAIFNSLLEFGQLSLVIPFLTALMFLVLHLFHIGQKNTQKRRLS